MASAASAPAETSSRPPLVSDQLVFGLPTGKTDEKTGRKLKTGWVWIPLSFFFLLLGVVLGLQIAMSVRSQMPAGAVQDPYTLGLSVAVAGDSLHVRWDRNAASIQTASRGVLVIRDGGAEKNVELDIGQLQNGSVIYRRAGNAVQFRLEVFVKDNVIVAESVDYRAAPKP